MADFPARNLVHAPSRTAVRGPTFIRLLATLTDGDIAAPPSSLSDRLSQWLDWTHALALSTALDGRPADAPGAPVFGAAVEAECADLRASLAASIAAERDVVMPGDGTDYAAFRPRILTLQRRMQAGTGHLRGRLRDMLANASADMARLAELDAAMERTLSPREHGLLGNVPALLGAHFERLRDGDATGAWMDAFRRDMQSVLLAELDVRFQPVEGLLAALRTCQLGRHV